jgi:hypothetical protein
MASIDRADPIGYRRLTMNNHYLIYGSANIKDLSSSAPAREPINTANGAFSFKTLGHPARIRIIAPPRTTDRCAWGAGCG